MLTVGEPITLSGTDCPEGHWASASLFLSNPKEGPAIFGTYLSTGGDAIETLLISGGTTRVTSGPNGTWTIERVGANGLPWAIGHHRHLLPSNTRRGTRSGFPLSAEAGIGKHALYALGDPWDDGCARLNTDCSAERW